MIDFINIVEIIFHHLTRQCNTQIIEISIKQIMESHNSEQWMFVWDVLVNISTVSWAVSNN